MKLFRWVLTLLLIILGFLFIKNYVYSTPQDPEDMEDIALEGNPRNLVINPDQDQAIISSVRPNEISIVDLETSQIVKTIHLKKQPYGLAVDRGLNLALVGFKANHRLAVIDLTTTQTLAEIKVGKNPCNVAVYEPDRGPHLALTANYGADTLSIIDLQTYKVIKTVSVGNGPRDVAVDQGLQRAVVVSEKDQQASVVDLNTYQVIARIPVGRSPRAIGINPETHQAVVANGKDKHITMINLEDWSTRQISVDKNPTDLAVNPLDNRVLVVCDKSRSLHLIDLETYTTVKTYPIGRFSRGVDVNYLTNKAGVIDDQTDSLTLIQLPNPLPEITSISPGQFPRGSLAEKLIIEGSGFIKSSTVNFQPSLSPSLPVTLVNNHKLEITLPASFFTQAGIHQVSVTNPGPEGGPSASKTIYVQNPVPILTTLEPAVVNAGGPGSTLTIYGSGFFPETAIWVNSQSRAATYVSSTELKINLSSVDLGSGGSLGIAALNPTPGGGLSNLMNLSVLNPLPVLSSLSPNSVKAGSAGFTLVLNGSGFLPGATVLINNSLTPSTWISTSRMETSVPVNLLTQAGSLSVAVNNPQPGGGQSGALSLTVTSASNVQPLPQGSYGKTYEDLVPANATIPNYDPKRFSLITGLVKDKWGSPLAGVLVGIHSRSEYGTVLTDDSGRFSLPTDGGGTITLIYQKTGFITSHRQVDVGWNTIATAETLVLIPEDSTSTSLTFDGNASTALTHRSTPTIDSFGTRSLTMVFTGDNQATIKDAQGVEQPLTNITVRATEYPTPESMPAKLPPTSAFTYCAELAVDGAKTVRFAKPVTVYVDNFLGFNVGEIVPVGYYDRDRALWVPSNNGVVVRLLDTNGDGIVDAYTDGVNQYSAPGLTDPNVYKPGATYWRVQHDHFTSMDYNWPFGLPPNSIPPNPEGDPVADDLCLHDDNSCISSYVENRSRIFHEDIPLPGMGMTLHYASNRIKEYKSLITIPASGSSVPINLKNIIVEMEVAGRTYRSILLPGPSQKVEYVWDGLDYLGRQVTGSIMATIKIGFVYPLKYFSADNSVTLSFSRAGITMTGVPSREEAILWKQNTLMIHRGFSTMSDGWTLSLHHSMTLSSPGVLYKGDGTFLKNNTPLITTVAGTGERGYSGDGGPATQASFYGIYGVDVDKAGNIFIVDGSYLIRKVDKNGIITTVAGNVDGNWGYDGDGGPAVQARFNGIYDIAVDDLGNIYIADSENNRIRKIDANGIINTIAGNGQQGYSGDGGPATQANLNYPYGIAVDSIGNIYIADNGNNRVRKVDTYGNITTIAGNGEWGYSGDGGSALQASLSALDVATDSSGNIYIADGDHSRVRKVDTTGNITTIAGTWMSGNGGDGGPAVQAVLWYPHRLTVDKTGNIYIADLGNSNLRKVDTSGNITTVAGNGNRGYSGDGGNPTRASFDYLFSAAVDSLESLYIADCWNDRLRQVRQQNFEDRIIKEEIGKGYVMDNTGLHKSTIDLATGKTLLTFDYDPNNNLILISDRFGSQTTIQRDGSGVPTSITSPDGIMTRLTVDGNNHLNAVTYPDNSAYSFTYTSDGLLTDKTDPRGNRFSHQFDSNGKITGVYDPEGGSWSYARSVDSSGTATVTLQTAEGNTTTYQNRTDSTGAYTSVTTDPSGSTNTFSQSADGLTETSQPSCGMKQTMKYDLDPVYKYKYLKQMTQRSPAGLTQTTTDTRTYQDTDGDSVSDLITKTLGVNGKNWTTVNNTLSGTLTSTSPLGRVITQTYNPLNLLTQNMSVTGLFPVNYGYDSRGRLTTTTTGSRTSTISYDSQGNIASIVTPDQKTLSYSYDSMNRLKSQTLPDQTLINYNYDTNGNLTVLTNPKNVNYGFDYTKVNLRQTMTMPLSGSYQYLYDKERNLKSITFPSGKQIVNTYTGGLLRTTTSPEGATNYNYNCSSILGEVTRGTEKVTYGYDGSLLTSDTRTGLLNQVIGYGYNNDFRLTSLSYAGTSQSFIYDNDGLMTGAGSFTITRNAQNGLPESVSDGTLVNTRTFSGYGELDGNSYSIGGNNKYGYTLTRDLAGRITQKVETVNGASDTYNYAYDTNGRLTEVKKNGSTVETYTYDANGNRLTETNTPRGINRSYTVSTEDHLINAGAETYQFDVDGFLISKTSGSNTSTYQYSSRGELLSATLSGSTTIAYDHDPLGRRISKRVNGTITEKYLWKDAITLLAVYDANNNLVMRFNYTDGRMPISMIYNGSIYYLVYDQIGSLRAVTDTSGSIIKRVDYDSFGSIISATNPAINIPFGFAGGLYDRDTGLIRFGARDYDSTLGRWTAKDPINFSGGDSNLYGYVINSPINFVDPAGLFVFGSRPLSGLPWIPGGSSNPIDNYFNTELSHEHGFFEDGSGQNIGFGPHGRFSEDPTGKGYRYDHTHYDDALMREALKNIKDGEYSNWPWNKNNCQDWAERLRKEYERLKKERDNSKCK